MFDLSTVQSENTSWKSLNPGISNAILSKVEFYTDKDGNVTENVQFLFTGTDAGNTGEFSFIAYANKFDPKDAKYTPLKAERALAQVKHIIAAYIPAEKIPLIKGETWKAFATILMRALNPTLTKSVPCRIKVILNDSDKNSFPLFPDFITTDLTPNRVLKLDTKINPTTQKPYDNIIPSAVRQSSTTAFAGASPLPQFEATIPDAPDFSFGADIAAIGAKPVAGSGAIAPTPTPETATDNLPF